MPANPTSVLVICLGNTCRSPMAAALAQKLLGHTVRVDSCGIEAARGSRPNQTAADVMKEVGVDISTHRTRNVREMDLHGYDLIITMEPGIAHSPSLSAVDSNRLAILAIDDPYGKPIDVYRATASEIESQLRELFSLSEAAS